MKKFNKPLEPGSYKFAFKVTLPEWLPASLQVSPVPKSLFKIDYKVFASLIPDRRVKSEPISNSRFFIIVKPLNEVPV